MSAGRLLVFFLLVGISSRSWSQTVPDLPDRFRNDVAGDRPQPELDPLGVRLGGFVLRADGAADVGYNSNIFGRAAAVVGSGYTRLSPSFRIASDWGRHAVDLSASADLTRFFSLAQQNTNDYRLHAGGLAEIGDRITVRPSVDLSREAEPRGSVGNLLTDGDPLYQRRISANLGARYVGGLFSAEMVAAIRQERYDAVRLGGVLTPQRMRDSDGLGARATLLYQATPALAGLVQVVADQTSNPHPEFCCFRDAHGYAVLTGLRLDPQGLLAGQVALGYRHRTFEGTGTTSQGLTYDARLQWYPTELITVGFRAEQQFRNSGITAASAVLVNRQTLDVTYEMYRNLNVYLQLNREAASYREVDTRTALKSLALRATYTMNRLIQLSAFARYLSSDTNRQLLANGYSAVRTGISARVRI